MANPTGRFFGAQGAWLWPVAAFAALVIVVLALRWLAALLFSTDRTGDPPIPPTAGAGRTILAAGALADAVAGEIESYRGVDNARARLIGDPAALSWSSRPSWRKPRTWPPCGSASRPRP